MQRDTLTTLDDVGDRMIMFNPPFEIKRLRFNLETEADVLKEHDLAILPPYPGPWGNCKSNNKKLTAGACGLASTNGMSYLELLNMVENADARDRSARSWREVVEERYTSEHGAENLREYLEVLS